MRKCIKILLSLSLAIIFFSIGSNTFAAKKKEANTKHKIEFLTKDKFILAGDLYIANPKSDKPLIVALHSFSLSAKSWNTLAENFRLKGYNVLAMDLRGHGRSIYNENLKLKSRYKFTKNDWQKLPNDVIESINYIKTNYPAINCNDIILIGADIGASAGVLAGTNLKKQPLKFVMISPMINFKGLYIPIKIANYTDTRFLILLSKSDKILFNLHTKTDPVIKTYPIGGPGNQLIKANKDSIDDIVNFVIN